MGKFNTCSCDPDCEAESKVCKKCGRELPLSEFYRHSGMADGHLNQCKDCKRGYQREHERRKYREDEEWREKERERGREKWRRLSDEWDTETDRRKKAANTAVSNAVRDGRLEKPDACERCGREAGEDGCRLEGHHEDYDRPLDVEWLCSFCHGEKHRREGGAA